MAYLHVKVNDVFPMHILHSFTDLPHEYHACALSENEILVYHSVKQLAAQNTAIKKKNNNCENSFNIVRPCIAVELTRSIRIVSVRKEIQREMVRFRPMVTFGQFRS